MLDSACKREIIKIFRNMENIKKLMHDSDSGLIFFY